MERQSIAEKSTVLAGAFCTALGLLMLFAPRANAQQADGEAFFEKKIRPVLVRECYGCHSKQSGAERGGLRLDTRDSLLSGGDSGPAIVPGDALESLLYQAITYDSYEMPPRGKLSDAVIADFKAWIDMGAPGPRATRRQQVSSEVTQADIRRAKKDFWAYQPPRARSKGSSSDQSWPTTTIDRYVHEKLVEASMSPAADADPHTILRRLTYDLVGLPPQPEQIDWFLKRWEQDPDAAVERVVDRLLSSDRFGERWGRHWLDVARYAESTGKEINLTFPYAWRYRDYVIDAFNEDKPYDQFLKEQIAGDLLPAKTDEQWSKNLIATSFLAIGPKTLSEQNGRQFVADLVDEQIDATTRVFLATSVACARCHDHKFDPIPQSDYYALAGIFHSTQTYYGTINSARNRRPSEVLLLPEFDTDSVSKRMDSRELEQLKADLREAEEEEQYVRRIRQRVIFRGETGPELPSKDDPILSIGRIAMLGRRVSELKAKLATVDENGMPVGKCMGVQERADAQDATLYVRGELDQPAQTVRRGVPQVLSRRPLRIRKGSSGRLELASWMTDEANPLTARVMANRVWKHLIGEGIVRTTENFGATGQPPTHPELLDYLAKQFTDSGWSVKSLVREIATSRVYRISSAYNAEHFQSDPENELLWRRTPRRLDAEAIRDGMLYLSGEIELERPISSIVARAGDATINGGQVSADGPASGGRMMGFAGQGRFGFGGVQPGPGGFGMMARGGGRGGMGRGDGRVSLDAPEANYRSVYMPIVRDFTPRSLEVFDFPDASMIVGDRHTSNTANQALYMMNNELVLRTSEALAKNIVSEYDTPTQRIRAAFIAAYGRPPEYAEVALTKAFLRDQSPGRGGNREAKLLAQVCQSLFASAEFRYQY